jgi:hypothetical protein
MSQEGLKPVVRGLDRGNRINTAFPRVWGEKIRSYCQARDCSSSEMVRMAVALLLDLPYGEAQVSHLGKVASVNYVLEALAQEIEPLKARIKALEEAAANTEPEGPEVVMHVGPPPPRAPRLATPQVRSVAEIVPPTPPPGVR